MYLLFFLRATPEAWKFLESELQPQKHQIQASSEIYATAFSNAWSLTHWARPGIEPKSSWIKYSLFYFILFLKDFYFFPL